MMSQSSKDELLAELRPRYRQSSCSEKQQILDEVVAVTGYHRKYAIRVLSHPPRTRWQVSADLPPLVNRITCHHLIN